MASNGITIRANFAQVTKYLSDVEKRQVPFAAAQALTMAAQTAKLAVTRSLPQVLENPTPFTMKSVRITAANKRNLTASVFIMDRAAYLEKQEVGGTATPKKTALVIPQAIKLNSYGNIARGGLAQAKAKPNVFVGKVNGRGGFWQRRKEGLKALVLFVSSANYKPRLGFNMRAEKAIRASIGPAFREAMRKALATARR